jgi:F-actin monooxygenase
LKTTYGIELENFVFFRDEHMYLVATPKISCLFEKGVLRSIVGSPQELLTPQNINREKLVSFGREMANYCGIPSTSEYITVNGAPDIQIFDFSTKISRRKQMKIIEAPHVVGDIQPSGLFVGLVGDALIEPFWPLGTGTNRALQR